MYYVSLKHGEVIEHTSLIDALLDYLDCIDNPPGHGATIWWEDSAK